MSKFIIAKDLVHKVRRFNLTGRKTEFKLAPIPENEDAVKWTKEAIREIVESTTAHLDPKDQVGITFCGRNFDRGPGWMNFKPANEVKMDDIWTMISKIFQSNSEGLNTDTFCLGVTSVRLPTGRGRGRQYNSFNEECTKRRGIVSIDNKDNLCLPRAIVVARAYADKDPDYVKIRQDIGKLQTNRVKELMGRITIPVAGASIPELQQFQNLLAPTYQIVVYSFGGKGRDVMFKGPEGDKKLNLLYHEGHFNVVTSLTAAFCCTYYCDECHVPHNGKNGHRCTSTCPCCQQSPPCSLVKDEIFCQNCHRKFRGPACFEKHTNGKICEQIRRCLSCLKTIRANREHSCGEIYCKICAKHQASPHYCFIQPDLKRPKTENVLFIFYDLETCQETLYTNGKKLHQPNLCVFQQRCSSCMNVTNPRCVCSECGVRRQILKCDNPIAPFLRHILTMRKRFKQIVVIAHNGQAFDHQFILRYALEETTLKPELIMRGSKIVLMQIENIKFLDSLNYFPMALAALPKAFDLGDKFKKGHFPHLFNTKENQNYIGAIPGIEYYDADNMKPEARQEFLAWHKNQQQHVFDFQKEFVDYCVSDVEILTEACLKFRQLMLDQCKVCPFTEATTIASTCNLVFRRNFLKPNTIGIIPKNGYRLCDNQSVIALKWLIWEEDQRKINISHAGNGKEAVLNGIKVDGHCSETNQIFEFHGCYHHGHPICLTHNRDKPLHDDNDPTDTLNNRYERTQAKTDRLRSFGYEVIEKWECEFLKEFNENMQYLHSHSLLRNTPLNPRDAFYGGRTGNTRMLYECKSGERIKYFDVCSLYPYICKTGVFPTGHPTLHIGDSECTKIDLEHTCGMIKCTILPPQDLYHPVLPVKMNNKLMFVLCYTCAQDLHQEQCTHNETERALSGTWVIEEVTKALEKGYKMLEIQEVWSFSGERYDTLTSTGGLFTEMMNRFLQMKQQASGWPSNCSTQEEKERYVEEFLHNEGIKLEFVEICKNPGLRCIAKLILNSFWGKFAQRENQPKTSIVRQPSELFEILVNPAIDVNHILPINEDAVIVNWEYKGEAADTLGTVNVGVAAYTTAQARLKLYSYLEKLDDRVLYYDTDSIIFISREGEWEPPTGEFVGDLTDELEVYGPGSYITQFVCGGPKNYAFNVYSPTTQATKSLIKVKGIKLNYKNSKLINFDTMKRLILDPDSNANILVENSNIRRTAEHDVVTVNENKIYRITSNKRKFFEDHNSLPYGYKKLAL